MDETRRRKSTECVFPARVCIPVWTGFLFCIDLVLRYAQAWAENSHRKPINWTNILKLAGINRTGVNLKDKYRNLKKKYDKEQNKYAAFFNIWTFTQSVYFFYRRNVTKETPLSQSSTNESSSDTESEEEQAKEKESSKPVYISPKKSAAEKLRRLINKKWSVFVPMYITCNIKFFLYCNKLN
jgi:hypothetical protein